MEDGLRPRLQRQRGHCLRHPVAHGRARPAFSCLPRTSVSPPPAPEAGSTCPRTSGSRSCKVVLQILLELLDGHAVRPGRTAVRLDLLPRLPHQPLRVWQTASRPALTCSLVSSQGIRPGCSGIQVQMSRPLRSAPITGASPLLRAGPPARAATVLSTSPFQRLGALPLAPSQGAVSARAFPCFRTQAADRARATCTPGTAWPAIRAFRQAHPGTGIIAPVLMPSSTSRRFSGGSLAFAFPVPA